MSTYWSVQEHCEENGITLLSTEEEFMWGPKQGKVYVELSCVHRPRGWITAKALLSQDGGECRFCRPGNSTDYGSLCDKAWDAVARGTLQEDTLNRFDGDMETLACLFPKARKLGIPVEDIATLWLDHGFYCEECDFPLHPVFGLKSWDLGRDRDGTLRTWCWDHRRPSERAGVEGSRWVREGHVYRFTGAF